MTSSNLRKWQPALFLNDQFDNLEAYTHLGVDHADRAIVTWLRAFHRKRQGDRPLFQFVFLALPHYNYCYPEQCEVDTPVFDPESIQTIIDYCRPGRYSICRHTSSVAHCCNPGQSRLWRPLPRRAFLLCRRGVQALGELQFGTVVPQRSTDLQYRPVEGADVLRSLNWCLRQHAAEVDRLHVPR